MNEFIDSIKVTKEDKQKAMEKILYSIINSSNIVSLNDVLNNQNEMRKVLNEDELLASYSLALEIKKQIISSNTNEQLMEYLGLEFNTLNKDNLLKFINQSVKDIETQRKRTPNLKWRLQTKKIFDRLEGNQPFNEEEFEEAEQKNADKTNKIIKFPENFEK